MERLSIRESSDVADLKQVAQARLREFKVLKEARLFSGAIYMGRFAVEVYLKCLICKRLEKKRLPELFHSHDLLSLLYFSGYQEDLQSKHAKRFENFKKIAENKIDSLRYQDSRFVRMRSRPGLTRGLEDKFCAS